MGYKSITTDIARNHSITSCRSEILTSEALKLLARYSLKTMMALDAGSREILQNMQREIVITVDLTYLLPILRRKHLVTEIQFKQLSGDSRQWSPEERNENLIRIIMGKGVNALDLFIEALKEEQEHLGHGSLAERLSHEQSRLKSVESSKSRPPETQPRTRKLAASAPAVPPKPLAKPQLVYEQDVSAVKYTLSVQGQNNMQNYSLMAIDERLQKQLISRLSVVEKEVKNIKDTVNTISDTVNISLEQKLGRAVEIIENKLDSFLYTQREQTYYTRTSNMEGKANSSVLSAAGLGLKYKDEEYINATHSNEYTYEQFYDSVAEPPVKQIERPKPTCEYDYVTTGPGLATAYMPLQNTNQSSNDGAYHYTRTIKQPIIPQLTIEYVEEERISKGKNGEVWLACDKKKRTKLVIKKPISREIFFQEKSVLMSVSHRNVVRLISASVTQSPVLIFEYAEKGNLLNCLKSSASGFSTLKLLGISANVACGMSELEKRAIVHCDVKAKSILIDRHFVCKVSSFSKAQCLKPGQSSYVPPSSVTVNVPVKWAAPEILSKRKFSIKSDIWAFAVLLSEVFSQGNIPYPNMDNATVKRDVQNGIKMVQPTNCPNEVYEVMKHCFELHAKNRPSFDVVHHQLQELYCNNPMSEASSSGSECEDL